MKQHVTRSGMVLLMMVWIVTGFSQTVTELVVPKYFGSKTASSSNSARTAFAVCLKVDGLSPNTAYDIKTAVGLVTDAVTVYGAGNSWNGTTFTGTTNLLSYFTTDATGSSGPFWVFIQPTGNASRFDAGQQHNIRMGWVASGGTMPSSPLFIGSKVLTALDIAVTQRTPATTDDGCFVKGSCLSQSNGKYMLMFDNVAGTGDPLFAYMIRPALPTQSANSELPAVINDIYMQTGTSAAGDYPAVIPIGANNPDGVRRVESRNPDNTIFAFNTSATGIWPSGANSTTALRRDVVTLTNTDTPLTPAGPTVPTVLTSSSVTNITFNTATGSGDVTGSGGGTITARGLCWGTAANPTISGSHSVEPGTLGAFTSNITGLLPNTTYHLRAYATTSAGTGYGADVTFSTLCEVMAPQPDFAASKVNLMVGESINFFDSTDFCPETWQWSFNGGDPLTSTLQNPTGITYNYPGDFTVCLTATNQWGQQTICKNAYIHVVGPTNAKLVMTEINYRSPVGGTDSLEFIEIYNNDLNPWNLQNFHFTKGIEYNFPNMTLNPQGYILLAKSSQWMQNTYGVAALQWNAGGALSNQGEAIVIKDPYGFVIDSVYYLPTLPWDTMANGKGPTLEFCDPNLSNTDPANWRHALVYQGLTPSGDSLWASPLEGCSYAPIANFTVSDSTIVLGQSVTFTDASSSNVETWFWEFERGIPETFSGQSPPPITYNIMGAYDVTLTVTNNAGHSVKYKPGLIQVGPSGTGHTPQAATFSVHPNPSSDGHFTIDFTTNSTYSVEIFSEIGVLSADYTTSEKSLYVNIPEHSSGLYLIRVTDQKSGQTSIQKLTVY